MFNHNVLPLTTDFGAASATFSSLQMIPKVLSQPELSPRQAKMPKNLLLPSGHLSSDRLSTGSHKALYISLLPA
ncbi:MAG: hypothetical protein CVV27_15965 [Candidatus Melainabacteria bacterium HGW-Melainabacteria-1]|nr:MAG: hypothetical protein CVV27_15965 [Candidatus Melainabacteria bacterium HGW-Melainabacteria-1]